LDCTLDLVMRNAAELLATTGAPVTSSWSCSASGAQVLPWEVRDDLGQHIGIPGAAWVWAARAPATSGWRSR
jgi:hypothetical protein